MTKKTHSVDDFTVGEIVHYKTKNNEWDRGQVTAIGEKFVFANFASGYSGAVRPEDLYKYRHTLPRND